MLTLRPSALDDYTVHDDGHPIGRIRYASERTPGKWLWHVTAPIPGGVPYGDAKAIDEAKARFKVAWLAFKQWAGDEALAKAYVRMAVANGR